MRKLLIITFIFLASIQSYAYYLRLDCQYEPLSFEEIMLQARMQAAYEARMRQIFDENCREAYRRYNNKDFLGFLTYSDYALRTGWHTAQLYYDRGVVYERMKDFKKAKKEYKKAKKAGSPMAYQALLSCKRNEKEYKRQQKEYKRRLKETRKRKHK